MATGGPAGFSSNGGAFLDGLMTLGSEKYFTVSEDIPELLGASRQRAG